MRLREDVERNAEQPRTMDCAESDETEHRRSLALGVSLKSATERVGLHLD